MLLLSRVHIFLTKKFYKLKIDEEFDDKYIPKEEILNNGHSHDHEHTNQCNHNHTFIKKEDPMVKWLRHHNFTMEISVRFRLGLF